MLIAATDADRAGRRLADRLAAVARETGTRFDMILPPAARRKGPA
jgi:predicted nuclease with TOPRIM domain